MLREPWDALTATRSSRRAPKGSKGLPKGCSEDPLAAPAPWFRRLPAPGHRRGLRGSWMGAESEPGLFQAACSKERDERCPNVGVHPSCAPLPRPSPALEEVTTASAPHPALLFLLPTAPSAGTPPAPDRDCRGVQGTLLPPGWGWHKAGGCWDVKSPMAPRCNPRLGLPTMGFTAPVLLGGIFPANPRFLGVLALQRVQGEWEAESDLILIKKKEKRLWKIH